MMTCSVLCQHLPVCPCFRLFCFVACAPSICSEAVPVGAHGRTRVAPEAPAAHAENGIPRFTGAFRDPDLCEVPAVNGCACWVVQTPTGIHRVYLFLFHFTADNGLGPFSCCHNLGRRFRERERLFGSGGLPPNQYNLNEFYSEGSDDSMGPSDGSSPGVTFCFRLCSFALHQVLPCIWMNNLTIGYPMWTLSIFLSLKKTLCKELYECLNSFWSLLKMEIKCAPNPQWSQLSLQCPLRR